MEVISIINQKGGVAKTTTAWALGVGLHKKGYRVLLVDMDAQCNLGFSARVNLMEQTPLYDVFKKRGTVEDALHEIEPGLDILVGGIDLASADRDFTQLGREKMLSKVLEGLKGNYDYVVVDCSPSLGVCAENAVTACNRVIIPMMSEVYALQGIKQLKGFIENVREESNPGMVIDGILITRVDERTNLYKTMAAQFESVAESMGTKVYDSVIHSTVAVGEVALQRGNLFDEVPNATATKDYTSFIDEFLGL